jgi:hypothetical protein
MTICQDMTQPKTDGQATFPNGRTTTSVTASSLMTAIVGKRRVGRNCKQDQIEEVGLACISVIGPFRVSGPDGRDRTPASALHRAILAILALAPDGVVSRVRLQDLLWSEKSAQSAAQNLRTTLHGLKRADGGWMASVVEIDPLVVRLRLDRVNVEKPPPEGGTHPMPELLEGFSLRGGGAEGFEDWLRDQRTRADFQTREPDPPIASPACVQLPGKVELPVPAPVRRLEETPAPCPQRRPIIGLLQPVIRSLSIRTSFHADVLLDRIAMCLRCQIDARCIDFRDLVGSGAQPDADADLYLRLTLYGEDDLLSVRVHALDRAEGLAWSASRSDIPGGPTFDDHPDVVALIAEVVDRTANTVLGNAPPGSEMAISPFHVLSVLFQLDLDRMGELRAGLMNGWDQTGRPIYPALLAYMNTFAVGEHWGTFDDDVREETLELITEVEGAGDMDGLVLALAGHAKGYVLHRQNAAADALARSVELSPQLAFCWDHFALQHLYAGRIAKARAASDMACRLGTHSPLRYTFETTQAMIGIAGGQVAEGTAGALRVLEQRPTFGAALRYGAAGLGQLGRISEAAALVARLRELDPDISTSWVDNNRMALRDDGIRAVLKAGLRAAGLE